MVYYDIHTHQSAVIENDIAIISVDLRNMDMLPASLLTHSIISKKSTTRNNKTNSRVEYYSVGIHPWYPDKSLMTKVCEYAKLDFVVAIGETGLDKITANSTDGFKLQQELFIEHIILSEKIKKPLIIHCIKAWGELLHIHKSTKPEMPWVVHGFRGKEILACQLLNAGMYLSFDSFHKADSLKAAWEKRRLLAETDNSNTDIHNVYKHISDTLDIPVEALSNEIEAFFIPYISTID